MRIQIRDLSPATVYGLQFRSTNGTAFSQWSPIFQVTTTSDTTAPATPANVTWTVQGTSFLGTWDAVVLNSDGTPCNDFSHYQVVLEDDVKQVIYKTNATRFDFSFEMNYASFGTPRGVVKFKVGAVDTTGNVSVLSTQITATNPAPAQPANFTASGVQESIILRWDSVGDLDLKTYNLYMSTSSSSFTPGPSNLIWSGRSTSVSWASSLYGTPHYFKVAAVDVFNTASTYASATASPLSSGSVDGVAPDAPTSLSVTPAYATGNAAFADFTVSWVAPAATDLRGYRIRYRPGTSGAYNFVDVPAESTTTIIRGLDAGTSYQFQAQSVDFSGNVSAWTAVVTQSITNVAPFKPSAPTLVGSSQSFRVSHDLQKAAGGNLESDVAAIEVYVGTTTDWNTASPTKVETITVIPGSTFVVTSQMPFALDPATPTRYVFVKAVDIKGLSSTNSDATAVTITGISGTYIADATIGAAKIVSLEANKLIAGSGIVNDLLVKSKLTVYTGGAIESKQYTDTSGTAGFRMTDSGLIIKSGSIAAAALEIQASPNIVPAQYAGFEFVPSYYKLRADTGAADSTATVAVSGSSPTGWTLSTNTSIFKYETQALQITNASGVSRTIYFGNGATAYNIDTETAQTYIYSMWVYFTGSGTQSVTIALSGAGGYTSTQTATITAGTWTRVSGSTTIPAGAAKTILSIVLPAASLSWYIDGLQVEEKSGSLTTPSGWRPPSFTRVDGGSIRTGELRSTTNVTVNGTSQPAWSINMQGNAQFGDAIVRGKILVGLNGDPDGGQSRIQSGNYVAGTTGWVIDSSGYAEFRNLAVNSIRITALDRPLQNTVSTKLYDYMEAGNLWRTVSGSVVPTTNDPGAYSASALLSMTGNSSVARDAIGVAGGIAFEPEVLYRISARVRQLTGNNATPGVYKAKIGVFGYDDAGTLCGYDGTNDSTKQYMVAADGADLPIFDGASTTSAGWQTFVGYLKGRGAIGTNGARTDQYNPAKVHENVRYIVPYVQLNIGNSTYVAQLDAFTIETFEAGAPQKIATDITGRRSVTIEAAREAFIDHGIRFYSGNLGEYTPGAIAHFFDNENSDASSLLISPPSESFTDTEYGEGNIVLRSRTANYIFNSAFQSGITGWTSVSSGVVAWESTSQSGLGNEDDFALKLTPVAGATATSTVGTKYIINPQNFPELIGQSDFTFSAHVNPNRDITSMTMKITIDQTSDTGVVSGVANQSSSGLTALSGVWTRLSVPINVPDGIPANTTAITVEVSYNTGVTSFDVVYVDDVQLEVSTAATEFKAAQSSSAFVNTDMTQIRGGLFVTKSDSFVIPAASTELTQKMTGSRADAPDSPFIILGNDLSNLVIGNFAYTDSTNKLRHFSEIGHLGRTTGRQGGGIRFYDESDEINPDRVELFNKANLPILYTKDRNNDPTKSGTTQDLVMPGFLFTDGTPPWKLLTKPSSFNNTTGGYGFSYYISNKRVYLRGMLDYNPGTGIPANTTLCTLPVEARPKKNVYGMGMTWSGSGAAPQPVLIFITTAGVMTNYGYATNGRYITFDSGFSFSIDDEEAPYVPPGVDTTPPSAPTGFSINAYSSGTSTGTYTLKWTASNSSDVASTRIVWRTDRLPTTPTDGNVITVANSASQAKSYNLSGLPVNKTISIRMWSIDKTGNFSSSYVNSARYLLASPVTIYCSSTGSWRDSFGGEWRTDTDDVYQGEYSGYNDNHRGLWFYGTQIADKMRVGGITRTITKATIDLHRRNTSHGAAGDENINLYVHGYTARPGGIPGLPVGQVNIAQLARNESATVTMPSSWYAFIADGTRKGFAIYSAGQDYAILDGRSASTSTGKLTIYHKG